MKQKYNYDYVNGSILAQEYIFNESFIRKDEVWTEIVLHSVLWGELETLKYGIGKGGDINYYNDMEENVYECGNLDLIEYVMEKKFFDMSTEEYFYGVICYSGDLEIIENFIRKKGCKIDKGAILSAVQGLKYFYYSHKGELRNILSKIWKDVYEEYEPIMMNDFVNTGESIQALKYLVDHPSFISTYSDEEKLQILNDVFNDYYFHINYEMKDYEKAGRDYLLSEISKLEKK